MKDIIWSWGKRSYTPEKEHGMNVFEEQCDDWFDALECNRRVGRAHPTHTKTIGRSTDVVQVRVYSQTRKSGSRSFVTLNRCMQLCAKSNSSENHNQQQTPIIPSRHVVLPLSHFGRINLLCCHTPETTQQDTFGEILLHVVCQHQQEPCVNRKRFAVLTLLVPVLLAKQ